MIIDHQAHWYPPDYMDSILGRSQYPRTEKLDNGSYRYEMGEHPGAWKFNCRPNFCDIEQQIADMDANGIDVAVLSANMVGDGAADVELNEAKEIHQFLNAEIGRVQTEYPGRIAGLCMLPLQDTESALEELERAAKLDLRGILLPSNIGGLPPVGEELWPVFERLEELGMPVYIHPANNSMLYDRGLIPILDWSMGWLYDSSVTALTMALNGLLDHCPRLDVVHAHLGGTIPYAIGRTARYAGYLEKPIEHPLEHYFKTRFYVDSLTNTPAAFPLAIEFYGEDRIVYGSDCPWHDHPDALATVNDHVSEEMARKILHENRVPSLRVS